MKARFLISVWMLCMATFTLAQTVYEDEMAVVYYMPFTQLAVTVEYDETITQPGPFYVYAERYLGEHNVVQEAQKRYSITAVRMNPHTIADPKRSFKVDANDMAPYLSITPEGLLYGYNVAACKSEANDAVVMKQETTPASLLMPLMEEQFVASSTAKMAEGAAKQIYQIRETRMNILAGDVEHLPADGMSMQLVLEELDKREAALAALFIGTTTVIHHSHTYYINPNEDVQKQIIGRFSQFAGIVALDNLSGEPIRLTINGQRKKMNPIQVETSAKKKAPMPSPLYYNLPGSATFTLELGNKTITANYPVAQYGIALPLAKSIFTGRTIPTIYFNTQTGNILSIQP